MYILSSLSGAFSAAFLCSLVADCPPSGCGSASPPITPRPADPIGAQRPARRGPSRDGTQAVSGPASRAAKPDIKLPPRTSGDRCPLRPGSSCKQNGSGIWRGTVVIWNDGCFLIVRCQVRSWLRFTVFIRPVFHFHYLMSELGFGRFLYQ